MDDRLRDQASTWTLQNDDDLRRNLETLRDNVTGTASHLTVNIEKLRDKLLNMDCGVEQLNTQLDLLKNAKFVENVVEDEDSRPKPFVPAPVKSKEEMVQIVVDAVKVNLNKVIGQLACERPPQQIENIPSFNHPDFASYSFIPPEYKRKPVESLRENNISTNLVEPPPPPSDLSPMHIPKSDPQIEQKSPGPSLNGIIKPTAVNNLSESEDEMDHRPHNTTSQPSMPSVPAVPDVPKFNGIQPKPVSQPAKARNLFSSDDEDEEEVEASLAPVAPTMPIKSKDGLMEQLAAKLKSKEAKLDGDAAPKEAVFSAPAAAQRPSVKEVEVPIVAVKEPPKVEITRKRSEQSQPTPAVRSTVTNPPVEKVEKPLPSKEEDLPSTSRQSAKVEAQRPSAAESSTSARAAPKKSRGLFSDSDSDGEFMVTKPLSQKPAIGQRKVEVPKPAAKKVLSTKKKSIFDSDSSDDDGFASFLKKPVTQEKKFTTGLVTQRNIRPASPVKEAPPQISVKKESQPEKVEPAKESSPIQSVKESPAAAPAKEEPQVKKETVPVAPEPKVPQPVQEVKPKTPEPSTPVTHTPAVDRRPSPEPSTSTDPLSVDILAEEAKTTTPQVKEPPIINRAVDQEKNTAVKKETVSATSLKTEEPPPVVVQKDKTPEPASKPEKTRPVQSKPVERKASSPDFSAEAPPPVPESFGRSDSPPEEDNSRSDQAPLEQDNLPPLPSEEFPSDSPPEPVMPPGKTPGKLNNAGFAAMLGSKLQAGPPGTRQSTSLMSTSATSIAEAPISSTSPSISRESRETPNNSATSPGGLCHLTKSRPRRPGVHRPTIHKAPENDKDKNTADVDKVNNGVASMKVSSTPPNVRKETALAAAASAAVRAKAASSTEKSPSIVKRTSSASKIDNGADKASKPVASSSTTKTSEKPAAKANIISASASKTLPAKKGLFDFSSSDEEQLPPQKITKAAATLKTSVTSTSSSLASSSSKTASSSSVTSASKTTAASSAATATTTTGSAKPAIRGLNKYKSMFNEDDDLDVSLFKKN